MSNKLLTDQDSGEAALWESVVWRAVADGAGLIRPIDIGVTPWNRGKGYDSDAWQAKFVAAVLESRDWVLTQQEETPGEAMQICINYGIIWDSLTAMAINLWKKPPELRMIVKYGIKQDHGRSALEANYERAGLRYRYLDRGSISDALTRLHLFGGESLIPKWNMRAPYDGSTSPRGRSVPKNFESVSDILYYRDKP